MQTEARVIYWDIYGDILGGFYLPATKAELRGKTLDQLFAIARPGEFLPESIMGWDITDTNPWEVDTIPY